jgi:Tfp pilus assembly protein PilV
MRKPECVKTRRPSERGFSILEVMIASIIMLVGIGGLMALFVVAAAKNAGQGNQATRCTEYAQDKMEQLLALPYTDTTSNVVGSVTTPGSGVGLSPGGSVDPLNPSANYVDYVNPSTSTTPDGVSATAAGAQYIREWSIVTSTNNVRIITVFVQAKFTADVNGLAPSTTLVGIKQPY